MNLIELLRKELEEKGKNWSTLAKAQYLYVRTGEVFRYDDRWLFTKNKKIKNEILNKEIDVTNVLDDKIVCKSWCLVYKELLDILLKECNDYVKTDIVQGKRDKHFYVTITIGNEIYKADMSICRDFMLIKKGMVPESFNVLNNVDGNMDIFEKLNLNSIIKTNFIENGISSEGGYLDYLKLVKEELIRKENLNSDYLQVSQKKFFQICKYFLETSKFYGMGVCEVDMLMHKSIKKVFSPANNFRINSICFYDPKEDECELIMSLPNNEGTFINYCLRYEGGYVIAKELKENIKKHVKTFDYNKNEFNNYIEKTK